MNSDEKPNRPRRAWLRVVAGAAGGGLARECLSLRPAPYRTVPVAGPLKYQDSPNAGRDCLGCAEFVPGKTPKDRGGCTAIPGDTEISPNGWCVMWEAKK